MNKPVQTPIEDLKRSALKHYDEAATIAHHWNNQIPRAIEFFYDYKQMSLWQKIKLAFTK